MALPSVGLEAGKHGQMQEDVLVSSLIPFFK